MKNLLVLVGVLITAISSASAQLVVDAEMFKANPNAFMGKTITIKNVVLKTNESCHKPGSPVGAVSSQTGTTSASSGAPVGVAGPSSGKSQTALCNPMPDHNLTKWEISPNNQICIQVAQRNLPMLPPTGNVCKDVTFRVTPSSYLLTKCSK